jgi:hypothetical protein
VTTEALRSALLAHVELPAEGLMEGGADDDVATVDGLRPTAPPQRTPLVELVVDAAGLRPCQPETELATS